MIFLLGKRKGSLSVHLLVECRRTLLYSLHDYLTLLRCRHSRCVLLTFLSRCLVLPQPERRGSLVEFADDDTLDELSNFPLPRRVDVEQLELQQRQRRNSLQMRRTSLADVIPDWPLLQHRKAPEKVHPRKNVPLEPWCWLPLFQ